MLKTLTLRSKLIRSAVLAPAIFMPLVWLFTFCRAPFALSLTEAMLYGAGVSLISAYLLTMYIECWRVDEKA
jgi:hypothetical protein